MTKRKKNPKKIGRPTKYKPEYVKAIIRFFDIEPHFEKDITITKSDGTQIDKTIQEAVDLPFFEDFADTIGVCHDTLIEWCKKYSLFSEAYKRAKKLQENILITNGLKGLYMPAFTIFTMKNVCGWRDQTNIEHSGEIKGEETKIIIVRPEKEERDRIQIDDTAGRSLRIINES